MTATSFIDRLRPLCPGKKIEDGSKYPLENGKISMNSDAITLFFRNTCTNWRGLATIALDMTMKMTGKLIPVEKMLGYDLIIYAPAVGMILISSKDVELVAQVLNRWICNNIDYVVIVEL